MADRRLQVFYAVATTRSFTRAAESLFMSQPAVTFQIRQLEEQYQVRLFERSNAGVNLTPAGEQMFQYAERILALNDELDSRMGELTGEMRGILAVGASTSIAESVMPRMLADFTARYPQVRPRLSIANGGTIEAQLLENVIDVALIGGSVTNEALESIVCTDDPLAAVCAPGYPLASLKAVDAKELRDYEYVAREPGSGSREIADAWFRSGGVAPDELKMLMEVGSPEALKSVVREGIGFAIVAHRISARDIEAGHLVSVPLKPALTRPLTLAYPKERFRTRLVSTFINHVRQQLNEALL